MRVRVWGVVEDRLIELHVEAASGESRIRVLGLPEAKARTTADRIRAALTNTRLVTEAPAVTIRLEPPLRGPRTSEMDLAIAVAVLVGAGVIGRRLRWILATGRLGLDGTVHARGLVGRTTLTDAVATLCQTPVVESEHAFGGEGS